MDKEHGASKFLCFFNLTPTLAFIVQKTFLGTQDYYIMEEGYKAGHGYYYIYVFKNEESNGSLSVGLSHRQDLHLLLMEGGLRQQIQEYYSVSIFPGISLLEAKKEWNGTFLARKRTHGSFRSLLASKRTNSSFRSHHINRSQ